ncbi:hemin ABC transporter substrate-binding protein [Ruegeria sp. Ofav3-42]|uniref:heme/hemin ABC transporter substrate-binding protein n=1 Tax=Ruegeria sp. Ofav3-42 TaxID=2917759 RepID=UPI001EF6CB57|nr:ABC transporter substrate-binding protein [Ruegeria sp. Ofav3-42]MCG7519036.1 ABC transporter substrate-binding protein [Ruegeria sp. Ofav3-42]
MNTVTRVTSTFAVLAAGVFGTQAMSADEAEPNRIIAIGSSVTEIVYALGQQDRLVGRDQTSTYPTEVLELPDVGYMRALSPEGVLSVRPDLIVALEGAGPPEAVEVLKEAGVEYVSISENYTRDGVVEKIRAVGTALGVEEAAEELAVQTGARIDGAHSNAADAALNGSARVLFVLSAQDNRILVGGADTQADSIIRLAGGVNAAGSVSGFKPMTPEAIASTAPDVILMMDRRGNHITGNEELFALPAFQLTPAGRNKRLIRMQGAYLLGFGPRTADAIADLSAELQRISGS